MRQLHMSFFLYSLLLNIGFSSSVSISMHYKNGRHNRKNDTERNQQPKKPVRPQQTYPSWQLSERNKFFKENFNISLEYDLDYSGTLIDRNYTVSETGEERPKKNITAPRTPTVVNNVYNVNTNKSKYAKYNAIKRHKNQSKLSHGKQNKSFKNVNSNDNSLTGQSTLNKTTNVDKSKSTFVNTTLESFNASTCSNDTKTPSNDTWYDTPTPINTLTDTPEYDIETVRQLNSQIIALNILQQLRLPLMAINILNVSTISTLFYSNKKRDQEEKVNTFTILADLLDTKQKEEKRRFHFPIPQSIHTYSIKQAILQMSKKSHKTAKHGQIIISTTSYNGTNSSKTLGLAKLLQNKWLKIDVTDMFLKRFSSRENTTEFMVRCHGRKRKHCPIVVRGARRPRLKLHVTKKETRSRRRRRDSSMMCTSTAANVSCCRESLTINLDAISNIYAPSEFRADFCRGECFTVDIGRSSAPEATYASYLHLYGVYTNTARYKTGCCVSTKRSPMSVAYVDDNGNMRTDELEDMRVTECGCRV